MKNVTMRDIGAALGVSTVTISKALGGKEGVTVDDAVKNVQKQLMYGTLPEEFADDPMQAVKENLFSVWYTNRQGAQSLLGVFGSVPWKISRLRKVFAV